MSDLVTALLAHCRVCWTALPAIDRLAGEIICRKHREMEEADRLHHAKDESIGCQEDTREAWNGGHIG